MIGWAILDSGKLYLDLCYPTRDAAERERLSLLKHFPDNHPWRKRLHVAEFHFNLYRHTKVRRVG